MAQADTTPGSVPIPEGYTPLTEGKATILQHGNDVFYNPAQVINRDLSIAVLKYFVKVWEEERSSRGGSGSGPGSRAARAALVSRGPVPAPPAAAGGIRILEGLAASGLRAIRYAAEIDGVSKVVANDVDPSVTEALARNVAFNGERVGSIVEASTGDARLVMLQRAGEFEAVDLDPYGSPSTLLDGAVQAVCDGGLLLVTATDMAVLCGNNSETCFAKYGSYPLHKSYCHEQALRIVLGALEIAAAKHKRHIEPLISLSIDFYVRVFVRVHVSAAEVKNSATRLGYVWQSLGCESYHWQRVGRKISRPSHRGGGGGDGAPARTSIKYSAGAGPPMPERCPETGAGHAMGGPFWAERLHDPAALRGVMDILRAQKADFPAYARVHALLTAASEELPDAALYVNLHDVCKTLRCTPPRAEVLRSALVNAGYRVSGTHACALGLKTDAPFEAFWDIMRCWIADHPVKPHDPDSYVGRLLAKEPSLKADFSRAAGATSKAKAGKVARFLPNPMPNWGPKPKHGRTLKPNDVGQARAEAAAKAEAKPEGNAPADAVPANGNAEL